MIGRSFLSLTAVAGSCAVDVDRAMDAVVVVIMAGFTGGFPS